MLAAKILEIGKAILKAARVSTDADAEPGASDPKRAHDAVKWIKKAFALVEKMEDAATAGLADLKV